MTIDTSADRIVPNEAESFEMTYQQALAEEQARIDWIEAQLRAMTEAWKSAGFYRRSQR